MQISAQLNNLRISPRKVRLVAYAIKGMGALAAKYQLDYVAKKSSKPISKLLDSALANGHNSFGLVKENLFIKDVVVNEGPKLKRFRPKGFGMTSPIEKKTSRIKIVLEERVPGLKAEVSKSNKKEIVPVEPEKETETILEDKKETKPTLKSKSGVKKNLSDSSVKKGGIFGQVGKIRKLFRRKAI